MCHKDPLALGVAAGADKEEKTIAVFFAQSVDAPLGIAKNFFVAVIVGTSAVGKIAEYSEGDVFFRIGIINALEPRKERRVPFFAREKRRDNAKCSPLRRNRGKIKFGKIFIAAEKVRKERVGQKMRRFGKGKEQKRKKIQTGKESAKKASAERQKRKNRKIKRARRLFLRKRMPDTALPFVFSLFGFFKHAAYHRRVGDPRALCRAEGSAAKRGFRLLGQTKINSRRVAAQKRLRTAGVGDGIRTVTHERKKKPHR